MSTTEGNKLIAEFMGAEMIAPMGHTMRGVKFPKETHGLWVHAASDLHYHTSWDWLMPVVDKIAEMDYDFTISNKWCCIEGGIPDYFSDSIGTKKVTTLEIVWEQAIQFITWYNKASKIDEYMDIEIVNVSKGKPGRYSDGESDYEKLIHFLDKNNFSYTESDGQSPSGSEAWVSVEVIPDADGWYLCFLVIKNECGTFAKEMRVLECRMAEWQITNNRNIRITHWMLLPQEPKRTVKLLQNKSKLNSK